MHYSSNYSLVEQTSRYLRIFGVALAILGGLSPCYGDVVAYEQHVEKIDVTLNGKPLTTFHYGDQWAKPCLHPLWTTDGRKVTRGFPLAPKPGESNDHIWHRGVLYGHGNINGIDFWRELSGNPEADSKLPLAVGRIVCREAPVCSAKGDEVLLRAVCDLVAPTGHNIGSLVEEFSFRGDSDKAVVDIVVTLHADQGKDLVMGDTEEGALSIRMADEFREDSGAKLINSKGGEGTDDIWGKRARWVNYATQLDGEEAAVSMFDHPTNPRHPTWWHARGYSLCNANPFGERDFTGNKSKNGAFTIPADGEQAFRYQLIVHAKAPEADTIEADYRRFVKQP